VARINELARKHKSTGLTDEELKERDRLRRQYIDAFKRSLLQQLEGVQWTGGPSSAVRRSSVHSKKGG